MTSAVIHIGLPKTGTTTFQAACQAQADDLADAGVLYPDDDWLMFRHAIQHQAFARRLSQASPEQIEEDVVRLRRMAEGYDTLLLSSERLAGMLRDPANGARMRTFRESLNRHFDRTEFVCVIRCDRAIVKSTLKTNIDGQGLRADGADYIRENVEGFYFMNRTIVETLGGQLKALRFEDLIADRFPVSLFRECVGFEIDLPQEKHNASDAKNSMRFLMSNVRTLLALALNEPTPSTPKVNHAVREFEKGIAISPEVDRRLREMLDDWIEKEMDAALQTEQRSLEQIYASCLARAAEA